MQDLPRQVHTALSMLGGAGFEAWIVGGCVRDLLLERTPQDFDITTNALPAQVEAVFSGQKVIETGRKHGTVTVLLDGMPLEITTYRVDLGYSDGRHPDAVAFTPNLRDDLARRDFTVNAMAWNPVYGLVDCFGGQADLEKGLLRCVGEPETRFSEDALRILRLLRFASKLGFAIEDGTAQAAHALREKLLQVSMERIQKELTGFLCGGGAGEILVQFSDVFCVFLPELLKCENFSQNNPYHRYDVLTHLAKTVDAAPPEPVLRLAALLHDIGKPDCYTEDEDGVGHFYGHAKRSEALADAILTRLRYDNDTRKKVCALVREHDLPLEPVTECSIRRVLSKLTPALFFPLLELKRADCLAHGVPNPQRLASLKQAETVARELLAQEACFSLNNLAVNGDDLIKAGVPQGQSVGRALQVLLDAVLDNKVANDKTALLAYWRARTD